LHTTPSTRPEQQLTESRKHVKTQNTDTVRPAPGRLDCACPGAACNPGCICKACDSRPDRAYLLPLGATFADIVYELLQTMSDDNCGDLVLTGVHRDDDRGFLVFDTAPGPPPTGRPTPVG
jgi:hypothetical protein